MIHLSLGLPSMGIMTSMRRRVAGRCRVAPLPGCQVVGCHMGARGVDNPIVRYKTQDFFAGKEALNHAQNIPDFFMGGINHPPKW